MLDETGLEILRLLKMRWDTESESGKSCIVTLEELTEHFGLPKLEMRDHMTLLETGGYVDGGRHGGGDLNPDYYITDLGKSYVILKK